MKTISCCLRSLAEYFVFNCHDCYYNMHYSNILMHSFALKWPLYITLRLWETGAGCNTFYLINRSNLIIHERWPKLISSEKVICRPDFHLGLEFNMYVVLERYHLDMLEVECCNMPHINWSRVSCNTLFLIRF